MLYRCYSSCGNYPAYTGCYVSEEWKLLSNFQEWMIQQDWQGKELDKDILFIGNKTYSSETCIFVESRLNTFLLDAKPRRGELPCGVSLNKRDNKYRARCSNPFTGKHENLGQYNNPEDAHLAWKSRKHELALMYADQQTDFRVAEALRTRYL